MRGKKNCIKCWNAWGERCTLLNGMYETFYIYKPLTISWICAYLISDFVQVFVFFFVLYFDSLSFSDSHSRSGVVNNRLWCSLYGFTTVLSWYWLQAGGAVAILCLLNHAASTLLMTSTNQCTVLSIIFMQMLYPVKKRIAHAQKLSVL